MLISGTTGIDLTGLPINNSGNAEVEGLLTVGGNVGIGTSSPLSTAGRTIHVYNNLNDGTVNSNTAIIAESANRNAIFSGRPTTGGAVSLQHITPLSVPACQMNLQPTGEFVQVTGTGIGYGTGAGGTVTQLTSKSATVTLNKPSGKITMNNSALAGGASIQFTVYNSLVSNNDTIVINQNNFALNTTYYRFEANASSNGAFSVRVTNITGTSFSDAIPINFTIIKGAQS